MRIPYLLVLALALPCWSQAQSLGDVAKKEKERRDKNKQQQVTVKELHQKESPAENGKGGEDKNASTGESAPTAESGSAANGVRPVPVPAKTDVDIAKDKGADAEKETHDRRRDEAEWRARMQQARARVAAAKQNVEFFSTLSLGVGQRYVDANGNTVISSAEQLQQMARQAKEELQAAEQGLAKLQEDARHANVPPGWLR